MIRFTQSFTRRDAEGNLISFARGQIVELGSAEAKYINAGLAESLGGGSGDFSTCAVTFVGTGGEFGGSFIQNGEIVVEQSLSSETETVEAVLYKGRAIIVAYSGEITSVTGDATLIEGNIVALTGSCTINIKGVK